MVPQLWDLLTEIVSGFITLLISIFTGITEIFYEPVEGFTVAGQFLLIGFGVSLVSFGLYFIIRLVKMRQ